MTNRGPAASTEGWCASRRSPASSSATRPAQPPTGGQSWISPLLPPCRSSTSPPAIEDRSIEVQLLLADRGQHRAPSIPDLIVAATAELAGLIVLHFDKDFDLITDVTGQPVEWLAVDDGSP